MNTSETNKNKTLTRVDFINSIQDKLYLFTEYKSRRDIYRIEYLDSFIKCAIQKTDHGVQIIYIDSEYKQNEHMIKLISYATFIIAYKLNSNRGFREIEFNNNGDIVKAK